MYYPLSVFIANIYILAHLRINANARVTVLTLLKVVFSYTTILNCRSTNGP